LTLIVVVSFCVGLPHLLSCAFFDVIVEKRGKLFAGSLSGRYSLDVIVGLWSSVGDIANRHIWITLT